MRIPNHRQYGFTLIELMTVVAIIGVLVGLALDVDAKSHGATPQAAADQVVSTFGLAHTRAIATRRIQRVQVEATQLSIWQATTTGLATPSNWQLVSVSRLPSGVVAWNAQTTVQVSTGAAPAQSASLLFPVDFRPDGQASAATVFLTDTGNHHDYRVLIYHASGAAYARESW